MKYKQQGYDVSILSILYTWHWLQISVCRARNGVPNSRAIRVVIPHFALKIVYS